MLTIPEEIKDLYRSDNLTRETHKNFTLRFYKEKEDVLYPYETLWPRNDLYPAEHSEEPYLTIENDRIVSESLQITESLSSDEDLVFGSCEGAELQITVADVEQDIIGKEFELIVEIGGYEMILGMYTVESFVRESDRRRRKITAYDRMRLFNIDVADWYKNLSFPMTLKAFRDSLCTYIGVPQDDRELIFDDMQISETIEPEQLSGMDVLKAICEINGCFGHIDKMGQLKYIALPQTGLYPAETLYPEETLYPSELGADGLPFETVSTYKQPMTYEDYVVDGISSLVIRQEENDVGANVGDGDNVYTIEGNFLVYGKSAEELLNIAQSLLPHISGRIYRPASLDCNCMPWLEVGDAIRVPTRDDIVETFVMKRTISGCQAMRDKIESSGRQTRTEEFTLHKQIIQLEGKAAIITKDVERISSEVVDFKADTATKFEQTATSIKAEATARENGDTELSGRITVEADRITAEVKRAQEAESAITQTADEIKLSVSKKVSVGDVTNQLNSELKIDGNSIALTTGHFTVDATNFTLDAQGNATFSGKITGGSIDIKNEKNNTSFSVDSNGRLTAKGGTFDGSFSAGDRIFRANSSEVHLGDFYVSETNRYLFQSGDDMTGMSGGSGDVGDLYLWVGFESDADYALVVNQNKGTYIQGKLYLNKMDIEAEIDRIWEAIKDIDTGSGGGGGGSCTGHGDVCTEIETFWDPSCG